MIMNNNIQHNKPTIKPDDIERVSDVLTSGWIAQGAKVESFEKALIDYLGIDGQAVAVSSGTAALYLALYSLGIGEGDEVILPTYVCSAVLNAIFFTEAVPVLVDVNPDDFNISFEEVKKRLGEKTKAIIVPHIYGVPADIDELMGLGVPVIEDCAQSIGAKINGQMVGTFGDLSIFSFYATKMLTTGQGGMVVSRNPDLIEKIRDFRAFDCRKEYKNRFNFQMTDIQAALGIGQIKKLPFFIDRRKKIAERYIETLNTKNRDRVFQQVSERKESAYYRFVMKLTNGTEKTQKLFEENGVQTIIPVETYELLHRYLNLDKSAFGNAEEIAKTTLSIPIYPSLNEEEVLRITQIMEKI